MHNKIWLAIALGGVAASAHAQFGNEPSKLELIKLKDDVYVIHNEYVPGNTTVVITNEGVILVDDKFEIDADNIAVMVKTVTNQPIKYVINTHYHGDHSGGNAKLQSGGTLAVASAQARARTHGRGEPVGPARHHDRAARHHSLGRQVGRDLLVRPRTHGRRRGRAVS